ncbi:uncharacterized protein [Parasteatoda tepidariorum]|uniref:uncharacterized protein isoform X2 n=1 Tax=Parasteatoda tepidariorum TaxID=114398 RepID=UPI0039BD455D
MILRGSKSVINRFTLFLLVISSIQPVFMTEPKCLLDVVYDFLKSRDVASVAAVDGSKVISHLNKEQTDEVFEEQNQSFNTPIMHDIDDNDTNHIPMNNHDVLFGNTWYFAEKLISSFHAPFHSRTCMTVFGCLFFIIFINLILETKHKDQQTQTFPDPLSLVDQSSFLNVFNYETAKIFYCLKAITSGIDTKKEVKAEEVLTDEVLHWIADKIASKDELYNDINLLRPEILLGIGELYHKNMNEKL